MKENLHWVEDCKSVGCALPKCDVQQQVEQVEMVEMVEVVEQMEQVENA